MDKSKIYFGGNSLVVGRGEVKMQDKDLIKNHIEKIKKERHEAVLEDIIKEIKHRITINPSSTNIVISKVDRCTVRIDNQFTEININNYIDMNKTKLAEDLKKIGVTIETVVEEVEKYKKSNSMFEKPSIDIIKYQYYKLTW